ncbi:MAG: TonB-dependent receptor plug domain-containing protein [[Pasteurella] mairii]|uniref:TonB-dependent receptor n=1 Tax=[Pasteurella] mairii TaxID=757 RepID=A0A379B6L3_9PAST|nr:TonB-dependent receptor plug domain-containing protein [[Pasteurella] mairii]SUB34131.1 TonB-dependent receptor [[Pasteurella] mairii]
MQHFSLKLPEIVVYGDQNMDLTGITSISSDEMKKFPVANGNITDYLKSNPHVRYENSDQDGFQRGEIKPDNISINGADFNQTAFFIDNVNINNDLAVDSEVFDGSMQVVPGISHTQAYFFDSSLLSKIEVQDHNISASLSGFTGGAVVAKTKQYDGTDHVRLKYRTTNSHWANMYVDSVAKSILAQVRPEGDVAVLQPKYNKHFSSLSVEKGLTENIGLVLGLSRRTSRIMQNRLIGVPQTLDKQNHLRQSDNALLNLNWTPNLENRFEFGLRYSNYREKKYYATNLNNNIIDYHKAYGATLAWVHSFNSGIWTNTLAYDNFKDKRKANFAELKTVSVLNEDYEPLYDYEEGGHGNSQLMQKNWHISTEYAFNPFYWGSFKHSISLGAIYQGTTYHFNRPQDVRGQTISIIQGESPLILDDTIAKKGHLKTSYQNIASYIENLISWRNLELRSGVRLDRDDYLENNNIAPRFVLRYKPFENTSLEMGANRYYGRSFSSVKLTDKILKLNNDLTRKHQNFSHLKTPYANELSFGLTQNIGNWTLNANYIYRNNKARIILRRDLDAPRGEKRTVYANGGEYEVNTYTLQAQMREPYEWGSTQWRANLGFDWLKTKRANIDKSLNPQELVFLDNRLMTRKQMHQKVNSNAEDWILRLGLDMAIEKYQLTWSNKLYFKAPIKDYRSIEGEFSDEIQRYRTFDYGKHVQWDASIRWQPTLTGNHTIYAQLDVLNVLNQTRKIRSLGSGISMHSEYGIYTPGREFWLEVGYEF